MYRSQINIKKMIGLALSLLFVVSCTNGKVLTTHLVRDAAEVQGIFTLTRYSGQDMNYFEVVSLLDIEGDGYEIMPYGAEFNYSVVKGLPGEEADRAAREYVKNHVTFPVQNVERRGILGPDGMTIGYEYRPLQRPFMTGVSDVLDIYYVYEAEGRVVAYIEIKAHLELQMNGSDNIVN
jgi:hypothetical protein